MMDLNQALTMLLNLRDRVMIIEDTGTEKIRLYDARISSLEFSRMMGENRIDELEEENARLQEAAMQSELTLNWRLASLADRTLDLYRLAQGAGLELPDETSRVERDVYLDSLSVTIAELVMRYPPEERAEQAERMVDSVKEALGDADAEPTSILASLRERLEQDQPDFDGLFDSPDSFDCHCKLCRDRQSPE